VCGPLWGGEYRLVEGSWWGWGGGLKGGKPVAGTLGVFAEYEDAICAGVSGGVYGSGSGRVGGVGFLVP